MAKLHDNLFLLVKPKAPHRNIRGICRNLTPKRSRLCGTYIRTTPKLPYFGPLEYLKTANILECVGPLIPSPSYLCEIHGGFHWLKVMRVASNLIMQQIWWVKICCMIKEKWSLEMGGAKWAAVATHGIT